MTAGVSKAVFGGKLHSGRHHLALCAAAVNDHRLAAEMRRRFRKVIYGCLRIYAHKNKIALGDVILCKLVVYYAAYSRKRQGLPVYVCGVYSISGGVVSFRERAAYKSETDYSPRPLMASLTARTFLASSA